MDQKWEAKVSTRLEQARADQIWPLLEDFFGLDKWFPGLPTCHGIHGANGQPGCIRYCSGFGLKQQEENPKNELSWSKERLLSINPAQMSLTYEIVDCNIGFTSYVSTVKIVPGDEGCVVEWSISLDPVAGCELEGLVGKYEVGLQLMVKKMEAAILAAAAASY